MHDPAELVHAARALVASAAYYGQSSVRAIRRGHSRATEDRVVFVVGCPRSGTTFVGGALGSQPGFVDLGEVKPVKAAVPRLASMPPAEAAPQLRRTIERVRRIGFVRHLRVVEQTPEVSFVLPAALASYPRARVVHVLRDGRDVVCSLLERGWLSASANGSDDVGHGYGSFPRFWVADDEAEAFERLSDAGRAASAWRHYTSAALGSPERTLVLRYEALVTEPEAAAESVAGFLHSDPGPLTEAFSDAFGTSVGRWRRELTGEQLADVDAEAGPLLRELGYA
jgi:hypothetical protein